MGKRRRARQNTQQQEDDGQDISKEIEEIKDPLQTLFKAANIKVKRNDKAAVKNNEDEKEKEVPQHKQVLFLDKEIDTYTQHFDQDRLNSHLKSEDKIFRVWRYMIFENLYELSWNFI